MHPHPLRKALLACVLALAAVAAQARPDPEEVLFEATPLTPAPVVVLDPGHGGQDWGATVKGHKEKDIALSVALRLKERLERRGARVKLTRDADRFVELDERVRGSSDGALFISLHADKVRTRGVSGMAVYAFGKDVRRGLTRRTRRVLEPLPPPSDEQKRRSSELAGTMVRSLRGEGFQVDAPAKAEYYVLKNPAGPSVLVELGFLSNPAEAKRLGSAEYQERVADALAHSVDQYLGGRPGLLASGR